MIRDESVYKGDAYILLLRVDPYHRDIDPDTPCEWHRLRYGLLDQLDEQRDLYEARLRQAQTSEGPSTSTAIVRYILVVRFSKEKVTLFHQEMYYL